MNFEDLAMVCLILARYRKDKHGIVGVGCHTDPVTITLNVNPSVVSANDLQQLKELGVEKHPVEPCFYFYF